MQDFIFSKEESGRSFTLKTQRLIKNLMVRIREENLSMKKEKMVPKTQARSKSTLEVPMAEQVTLHPIQQLKLKLMAKLIKSSKMMLLNFQVHHY